MKGSGREGPPALVAALGGAPHPVAVLSCPEVIAPRSFILGVVAVQVAVVDGRVQAQLRAHQTGASSPLVVPLGSAAVVHVQLSGDRARPPVWPPLTAPALGEARARLQLFLGGEPLAQAALGPALLGAHPPPRAFGHVFCRWLRGGAVEPGFDLTEFLALAPGAKYERLLSRTLAPGQIVSYAFAGG